MSLGKKKSINSGQDLSRTNKAQINDIRIEKGDITTNPTHT